MPAKKIHKKLRSNVPAPSRAISTKLKVGDMVMVIAGGNSDKRANVGKTGRIKSFGGFNRERVIVEGLNLFTKHKRQTTMQDKAGKIMIEAPIHISNVMYYAEKIAAPVKLKTKVLADGKKVRGYSSPKDKEFVQI